MAGVIATPYKVMSWKIFIPNSTLDLFSQKLDNSTFESEAASRKCQSKAGNQECPNSNGLIEIVITGWMPVHQATHNLATAK